MLVRVIEDADETDERFVAIYIRVTQEESVTTDLSIPNQRSRALEVCGERGWPLARLYIEPKHVKGSYLPDRRAALAALLRDVERGRVVRVLVRHTDRLWRGSAVQDLILGTLRRASTELWDFAGMREMRSAGGRFALKVLGAAAELETDMTAERIREMKRGKARKGKTGGGPPPFGYTSQARLIHEAIEAGTNEDEASYAASMRYPVARCFYVDEREALIVRLIFELYLREGWGCRRIATELNGRGHRRRSGKVWVASKVLRVINDPVVAGYTAYDEESYAKGTPSHLPRHRQALFPGIHEALISKEQWHEAQRRKDVNAAHVRTKTAHSARCYPLSGVLSCSLCGTHMRGHSSGAEYSGSYRCSRRAYYGKEDGCAGLSINQVHAETTVWRYLDGILGAPPIVAEVLQRALARENPDHAGLKLKLEALRSEVARLEAKQRKWLVRLEELEDDEACDVAWERVRELKAQLVSLRGEEAQLNRLLSGADRRKLTFDDVARALAKLQVADGASQEKRRAFVRALVERHDLRVQMVDRKRLAVSLRLDPTTPETSRTEGARLVIAGAKDADPVAGRRQSGARPMYPGSPVPGGPDSNKLCPPATATSTAARARCWPRTSDMSTGAARRLAGSAGMRAPSGAWLRSAPSSSPRCWTAWTSRPSTTSASPAPSAGTITPRRPDARASRAAASVPRTLRTSPSRPSSPSTSTPSSAPGSRKPSAVSTASAIGRSSPQPGLRRSAGARLIVTRLSGRS